MLTLPALASCGQLFVYCISRTACILLAFTWIDGAQRRIGGKRTAEGVMVYRIVPSLHR